MASHTFIEFDTKNHLGSDINTSNLNLESLFHNHFSIYNRSISKKFFNFFPFDSDRNGTFINNLLTALLTAT